jgi:hypothetical protein
MKSRINFILLALTQTLTKAEIDKLSIEEHISYPTPFKPRTTPDVKLEKTDE